MLALSEPGRKRLAYGFWRYREGEIDDAVEMLVLARENGIDHFDTADIYGGPNGIGGSERLLGAVRARAPERPAVRTRRAQSPRHRRWQRACAPCR